MELEFTTFLKNKLEEGLTKDEVINEIYKNDKYFYLYSSKYLNYNKFINDQFKKNDHNKPIPVYGEYWIPSDLSKFLKYLDNFVRIWCQYLIGNINNKKNYQECWEEFVKIFPQRPCSLYIQGSASCGKTSLISCFKEFSYWCNGWNFDSYEKRKAFNFFDDYDGAAGNGSWESTDFTYLKPWLGCQQVVSISGKYKMPKTVPNHKPCVFISNKKKKKDSQMKVHKNIWTNLE
ncbi:hypothetical protein PIROE2DRAFT_57776 [Piromyces sp. E2]|nr:hypothetical protein PIROE2DRAFT_57776 [Piromyces sp. E2]|eukprot:OUM68918.1 hypothetical protein PIROE2DRAFT_57776 [Piromyces sp. E2]